MTSTHLYASGLIFGKASFTSRSNLHRRQPVYIPDTSVDRPAVATIIRSDSSMEQHHFVTQTNLPRLGCTHEETTVLGLWNKEESESHIFFLEQELLF